MKKIESLENQKVKEWSRLKEKKYRDLESKFLIEGDHLIEEAQKHGIVLEVLSLEEKNYPVPSYLVTKEIMKKLSEQQTFPQQMAVCQKLESKNMEGNMLILDGIQDPGNLGTILRSAVAFDFANIFLSSSCVDLYNPKVIRSTEGMFFELNIVRGDLVSMIGKLKEEGYEIIGLDMLHGEAFEPENISEPYAFVIGSEGKGLSKESLELCTKFCYLPMSKNAESLNAAVCASILLYEMSKRRL